MVSECFICSDSGEVIDVARLRHTDHWMQEQRSVYCSNRAFRELFMRTMKRISSLERNDVSSLELFEPVPALNRSQAKILKIKVRWQLDDAQAPGDVDLAPAIHFSHERMARISGAQY